MRYKIGHFDSAYNKNAQLISKKFEKNKKNIQKPIEISQKIV
jgi:ribosomal protein S17E